MNPSASPIPGQIDKRRFTICVAGLNIEVSTVSTRLYDLYAGYRTSSVPDYSITITPEDIKDFFVVLKEAMEANDIKIPAQYQ